MRADSVMRTESVAAHVSSWCKLIFQPCKEVSEGWMLHCPLLKVNVLVEVCFSLAVAVCVPDELSHRTKDSRLKFSNPFLSQEMIKNN